ncbi:MAG TPA: type VI secretion system tube protein Hcp [Burkholderiales bacterium]|nr:type VI secretion system tube protein Hcp [Burkholderiales bacterium]
MATSRLKIFLKLDGIEGESTVKGHDKEIAVLSYEQAVEVPTASGGGGGGTTGRPRFSAVRIRKDVDKASVPMLLACATGRHLRHAIFTFRHSPGTFDFYKVILEDVSLTKVAQRAGTDAQYPLTFEALNAGAASDGFLDEVTLAFARIRWEHRAQRPNGGVGTTTSGGWDISNNVKL